MRQQIDLATERQDVEPGFERLADGGDVVAENNTQNRADEGSRHPGDHALHDEDAEHGGGARAHGAQNRNVGAFVRHHHHQGGDDIDRAHQDNDEQHHRGDPFLHRQGVEQARLLLLPGADFEAVPFRQSGQGRLGDGPRRHDIGDLQAQGDGRARVVAQYLPGLVEMQQHDVAFAIDAEIFKAGNRESPAAIERAFEQGRQRKQRRLLAGPGAGTGAQAGVAEFGGEPRA